MGYLAVTIWSIGRVAMKPVIIWAIGGVVIKDLKPILCQEVNRVSSMGDKLLATVYASSDQPFSLG